jgi:hypothetical protein
MHYDALQAKLEKRFGSGIQGQIAYTFSKGMTDSMGYFGSWAGPGSTRLALLAEPLRSACPMGTVLLRRNAFTLKLCDLEVPVGRTRRWGRKLNPIVDRVIGNWRLSGIVQFHGGFPLAIVANDASAANSGGARSESYRKICSPEHVRLGGRVGRRKAKENCGREHDYHNS